MRFKKAIGRALPYPLIEHGRRFLYRGSRKCPVCENSVRRFLDYGYGFDVLERLQVVGGRRRERDVCPVCHSSARERLIWFWLSQKGEGFRFPPHIRIAHFAPEKALSRRLSQAAPSGYAAYDLDPSRYRHLSGVKYADLSDLPIESASVDLLVCNHVLEHVPDLKKALSEIMRVMAERATAVLQVPIALALDETIELPPESSGREREEKLGQDDHLRLFSLNSYMHGLKSAGLQVEPYSAFDDDPEAARAWQLDPAEVLFTCRK
ncbi:methyltransferase domain-containing protein [Aurantiacibacter sediminis]|uniref:Methyltransferase domain-containing protein n=1 Tax=Aurantiacibacter sediminis TaxID=2793064 RepID=A0ABS0MZV6_9SPHN|nr:methyltransferase domain-containing protein [Aurantiacibacter sediminis]MBH5321249.1 methyltransferase domain-containing protein [Aurantiacibacter sediminis]